MGNFTGAELNRVGKPRGLTGLAHFPAGCLIRSIRTCVISALYLRYINELEQVLVDKIGHFFFDLISGPTCVLELKV